MTNENEKQRIYLGISQPTHNASAFDDTTRGGTNGKEKSFPRVLLTTRQGVACRNNEQMRTWNKKEYR